SLTTLGRVVALLAKGKTEGLPFRESKLTRLLQDSLGANCLTTLVAALNPSEGCCEENAATLLFAKRAREVQVAKLVKVQTGQST
ncbi:P-loop containing nucleoside triphosphate hydrolase protein, partial [Baffinella frigidus]